jgi:hypothetical protein
LFAGLKTGLPTINFSIFVLAKSAKKMREGAKERDLCDLGVIPLRHCVKPVLDLKTERPAIDSPYQSKVILQKIRDSEESL